MTCDLLSQSAALTRLDRRLAVGAVDANAGMWVTEMVDPASASIKLSPALKGRHHVFRTLQLAPGSRTLVSPGVCMCHLPGIGHPSGAYTYEEEQVVALGTAAGR